MNMTEAAKYSSFPFDVLLALLFPLCLLLIGRKILPSLSWPEIRSLLLGSTSVKAPPLSLRRAYTAYTRYAELSSQQLAAMQQSYAALGRKHKQLGYKIGYPAKLNRLKDAITENAIITSEIARLARNAFKLEDDPACDVDFTDLQRVRESLKHFIRDWSKEGADERERIFQPILRVLCQTPIAKREGMKVLVPGCGLGRLAWEISQLGYIVTAVDFSYFMTLAMRFILSESTARPNEHRIRPYAHWFSHQRSNDNLFRSVSFPDVLPRFSPRLELIEGDFLKLDSPSFPSAVQATSRNPNPNSGYDFIVTLFFIDTSFNVFATIEKIYEMLKPGGIWINLGPLLWSDGVQARAELSLDEVIRVVQEAGFTIHRGQSPSDIRAQMAINCVYTGDQHAMMSMVYHAEFWIATKEE